ncbi:retrovirus-related pol polyprotein from transposon TNT 1-94 [Tanacetum coccineum]
MKEEVYVKQPPSFESSEFPNHVCKFDKALYGLKQAPRALYETLSTFLTEHKFVRVEAEYVAATRYCASILWMKSELTNYDITYEKILKGDNELHFIPTQYQLVDIFTKPLDEPTFKRLIVELGRIPKNLLDRVSQLR